MTTNPNDYINLLELFRVGLTHGLITEDKISLWTEDIITKDAIPDSLIIDLYFASHKNINEIVTVIDSFIYDKKPVLLTRSILSLMYYNLLNKRVGLQEIVSSIYWLHTQTDITTFKKKQMFLLDDEYDKAVNDH